MILNFSKGQVWTSIVDPDQIASDGCMISLYCLSFSLIAGITLVAKPYCSDFKIITVIVQVPRFFGFLLRMWQILIWHS